MKDPKTKSRILAVWRSGRCRQLPPSLFALGADARTRAVAHVFTFWATKSAGTIIASGRGFLADVSTNSIPSSSSDAQAASVIASRGTSVSQSCMNSTIAKRRSSKPPIGRQRTPGHRLSGLRAFKAKPVQNVTLFRGARDVWDSVDLGSTIDLFGMVNYSGQTHVAGGGNGVYLLDGDCLENVKATFSADRIVVRGKFMATAGEKLFVRHDGANWNGLQFD